jgi:hypothetical protein
MKSIKVKVPAHKVAFFLELMNDLKLATKVSEKPSKKNVIKDIEKEFNKMRNLSKEKLSSY